MVVSAKVNTDRAKSTLHTYVFFILFLHDVQSDNIAVCHYEFVHVHGCCKLCNYSLHKYV